MAENQSKNQSMTLSSSRTSLVSLSSSKATLLNNNNHKKPSSLLLSKQPTTAAETATHKRLRAMLEGENNSNNKKKNKKRKPNPTPTTKNKTQPPPAPRRVSHESSTTSHSNKRSNRNNLPPTIPPPPAPTSQATFSIYAARKKLKKLQRQQQQQQQLQAPSHSKLLTRSRSESTPAVAAPRKSSTTLPQGNNSLIQTVPIKASHTVPPQHQTLEAPARLALAVTKPNTKRRGTEQRPASWKSYLSHAASATTTNKSSLEPEVTTWNDSNSSRSMTVEHNTAAGSETTPSSTTPALETTIAPALEPPRQGSSLAAVDPIPRPNASKQSSQSENNNNTNNKEYFVRLNMKNGAGSCRGARNKKTQRKSQQQWEARKKEWKANRQSSNSNNNGSDRHGGALNPEGIDPVDDLLDGTFTQTKKKQANNNKPIPLCSGHQQPCKQLVVKKNTSGNKGRGFYCCALPRGDQCNFFAWVDDTKEAVQAALMKNRSFSGFVGRQVASYTASITVLTIPELQALAQRHGLPHKGKKKELVMRLSLWAREELLQSSCCEADSTLINMSETVDEEKKEETVQEKEEDEEEEEEEENNNNESSDDSSTSSEELELFDSDNKIVENEQCSSLVQKVNSQGTTGKKRSFDKSNDLHSALEYYFGHSKFRPSQEWAIRRCLEGKRTLLVAPTGSGKSLCYALPAALMKGVCIVVSPLIALIQDQIRVLPPSIPVATLSGQQQKAKMAATLDDISRGRMKIVFVSPEKLTSAAFRRMFLPKWNQETKQRERYFPDVSLLCIDEAHCLSQWAHNFRPSYLRFKNIVDLIQPKSVLALTATAGPRVVSDVCTSLGIEHAVEGTNDLDASKLGTEGVCLLKSDRDNIEVACELLDSQGQRIDRLIKLLQASKGKEPGWEGCLSKGSVIVYVWRQLDAEAVAENIQSADIEGGVVVYHGGMDSAERAKAQSKFIRGKARIVVATVAFGLGINKANVRGVIHMNLSSSTEHFLQEIGRAGRDGKDARAIALILKDEVLVRHSLAHSDSLVLSQISKLLSLVQQKTEESLTKIQQRPSQMSIGIPVSQFHGCKPETIETLLSLLEADNAKKLLRIDGFFYDTATISPRRAALEQLAEKEDVIKALMKCSKCLEPAAGEKSMARNGTEDETRKPTINEHGFGSFQFLVTECANCLGPNAEPRHVFAALRRLQQSGEIEFLLETGSSHRALNIRLLEDGLPAFLDGDAIKELALGLYESIETTMRASAAKVLHVNRILRAIAAAPDPNFGQGKSKSKTLLLFQDLVRQYFDSDENPDSQDNAGMSDSDQNVFEKLPGPQHLSRDVESVLILLRDVDKSVSSHYSDEEARMDLAALNAAKFLHGIVPQMMEPSQCRHHHLFRMYQTSNFPELYEMVKNLLRGR